MACKLRCPACRRMLKEEGDEMKRAQGEYRVRALTAATTGEQARQVECLECGWLGDPSAMMDY